MNRTFDGTQNSPYEFNKTLCFVRLVRFIFTLKNSRSRQTLENSHTTKNSSYVQKTLTSSSHVFVPYLVLLADITLTRVGFIGKNSLTIITQHLSSTNGAQK